MEKNQMDTSEIIKRLNLLILINLENASNSDFSIADKIAKLNDLGVPSADISRIIGKSINYVTATLSQRKTRKLKGDKKNG